MPRSAAHGKRAASDPAADLDDGSGPGAGPKRPRGRGGSTAAASFSSTGSIGTSGGGGGGVEEPVTVGYQWLDPGRFHAASGRHRHRGIRLTVDGASFAVRVGDAVHLNDGGEGEGAGAGDDSDGGAGASGWVCRVEELWDATDPAGSGSTVRFRGRWFFGRADIARHAGAWTGSLTAEELVGSMRPGERVLSDIADDNDIGSIMGVARPVYRDPGEPLPAGLPADSFLCRYTVAVDEDGWRLAAWDGASEAAGYDGRSEARTETNDTLGEDEEDDDGSMTSASSSSSSGRRSTLSDQVRIDGEGSNLRSDIQIGPKYQVTVAPFISGKKYVPTRQPKRVWTANAISEKDLTLFLDKLATVHNAYLEKHGLSSLDGPPYSPLSTAKAEELMRALDVERLCASHMSTAASLTSKRNKLLKECDIDAVLELLHNHDYDTEKALKAAKNYLAGVTTGWTKTEKVMFNDGYRQEQGSIRDIAKLFHPMKTDKDVIDYWYRFKMADQFRLYLDKKRDQAIRMMECIEKRRYHEFTLTNGGHRLFAADRLGAKASHWSETSVANATSALEDRRSAAKALLLDVNERMGGQVTAEIAAVIRRLHENYDARLKKHLFTLLTGHSELQQRFLEFLPKG